MTDQEQPRDEDTGDLQQIQDPAKLVRVGSMVRGLHQEARELSLDETNLSRLREIHEEALRTIAETLTPEMRAELERLDPHLDSDAPSQAEMRLAHAQLVGWLEGILQGIQSSHAAQQDAADPRQQPG